MTVAENEGHGATPRQPAESTALDLALLLAEHARLLVAGPLAAGLLALGITFVVKPVYTARTLFLPPQQAQSSAAAALSSLGALSGLAGAGLNLKSPVDQYAAMLQSYAVADRIIERFDLMTVYDDRYRDEARRDLAKAVRISVGRKDGLITLEVEDEDPKRAAEMANAHVDELRRLTSGLALTEAQERRVFFGEQLKNARDALSRAQQALQASGFNPNAIKAEPKAAAERYGQLQAQVTATEVRLQALRRSLAESAPEIQQQLAALGTLRAELAKIESTAGADPGADYISRYRDFKYEETLFDLFSRQYELARVDESREGALIQVIDPATPPDRKTRPHRALIAIGATVGAFVLLVGWLWLRNAWQAASRSPATAAKVARLRAALGLG